jgi:hypothetical protein
VICGLTDILGHNNIKCYDNTAGENGVMKTILITLLLFTVRLWHLNMLKKNFGNKPEGEIGEHVRITVRLALNKFLRTDESKGKLPIATKG